MTFPHRNNGPQMVASIKKSVVNAGGVNAGHNAPQIRPVICDRPPLRNAEFEQCFAPRHREAQPMFEATPIWLSALDAASCSADDGSEGHAISWNCISGRAVYTNAGANAERIEPLGVNLQTGQTLAVYWMPGETAYTVEVYGQTEMCA